MSLQERFGFRNSAISVWHRPDSLERFIGSWEAERMAMIDIDACPWVEYDKDTKVPLMLIETAINIGQSKTASVTRQLALMAGLPAYLVLYTLAEECFDKESGVKDIKSFRVRQIAPLHGLYRSMGPAEFARFILEARRAELQRQHLKRLEEKALAKAQ